MSSKYSSNNSSISNSSDDEDIDWTEFIINDKYIVLNKIGKGSYCTVWSVYDISLQKLFALKIYNEEDTEDAKNEIEVLKVISSFNLSDVVLYNDSFTFDYGDDVYVMQIIELCGYSLNYIIKLFKVNLNLNSQLYEKYVNFIYNSYLKLINILQILHMNGYCHTDIKPENILIDLPVLENKLYLNKIKETHINLIAKNKKSKIKNFNKVLHEECKKIIKSIEINDIDIIEYLKNFDFSIKLSDFGTALKIGDSTIYKKHTQYYKSPKILLKYDLDYTYDFWSLSCTIYELLCCDILFDPYNSELEERYGDNDDKNLMYLIVSALGVPDKKILYNSKNSDIYFDSTYTISRGYIDIKFNNFIDKLLERYNIVEPEDIKQKFINLINFIVEHLNYSYLFKEIPFINK